MTELLKLLSSSPLAANILAITAAVVLAVFLVLFVVGFLQGREISIWPPKMGARPTKQAPVPMSSPIPPPDPETMPTTQMPAGENRPDEGGSLRSRPQERFVFFPPDVNAAVRRLIDGFRLPDAQDLVGSWSKHFDEQTLSPLMCSGQFTDSGVKEYAFFVLGVREVGYRVVLLTEDENGEPILKELERGEGRPTDRYLAIVEPGNLSVSSVVWKHGGLKTLRLRRQAILLGTYGSAASVFFWDEHQRRFVQQWISD